MAFVKLGLSESGLKMNVKHANKHVKGMYANHMGSGFKYAHNPNTKQGNIYNGAQEYSTYLAKRKDNILSALWDYKGRTKKGLKQAKYTLDLALKF